MCVTTHLERHSHLYTWRRRARPCTGVRILPLHPHLSVGGAGVSTSITGSSVTYAVGGNGSKFGGTAGSAGTANRGNGGFGGGNGNSGGNGGSGIVIIRFSDTQADLTTIAAGLTYTKYTTGGYKYYKFTAGTGSVTV